MVDMGILLNNMKTPSPEPEMKFWSMTINSTLSHDLLTN